MSLETLLEETGGFGRFQVSLIFCLFYNKLTVGWSMLQMSYAGRIPDWHCLGPDDIDGQPKNDSLKACEVNVTSPYGNTSLQSCDKYLFAEDSGLTVINEWDLVCDMKHVKAAVTSIQMAGVLVGAFVSGQMGDWLGRKKTTYLFTLEHAVINIITAFSVNWPMFAVCRFLIGIGIGGILVIIFPYPMEFMSTKWRPVVAILPVWIMGVSIFAAMAMWLENWSYLHIACGVITLPGLLGYFYAPESLRWLSVQGRIMEAREVVEKMARINKRPVPEKTDEILKAVAEEEKKVRESGKDYTYRDVFRDWYSTKITLIFCFLWMSLSIIYYGISFGVSSLAGNLYLNIFLLSVIEYPLQLSSFWSNNIIGRKWTSLFLFLISLVSAIACLVVNLTDPPGDKDGIITGLSLTAKMGVGAVWAVVQIWGTELYPTVTRNLGYGAANTSARIGGIIAPFVIDFDNMVIVTYVIITALLAISILLVLATPETKGTVLADSFALNEKDKSRTKTPQHNAVFTVMDEKPTTKSMDESFNNSMLSFRL